MKYQVVIKKIMPQRHNWLRYAVLVYWDKENDLGDISWSYTLRGAQREAKKLIKKHERLPEVEQTVKEYEL